MGSVKGTMKPTERAPNDQSWSNLRKGKITMDDKPKYKVNIQKYIQI